MGEAFTRVGKQILAHGVHYADGADERAAEHILSRLTGWQDISTAPRDGTEILVWTDTRADEGDARYVEEVCDGEHFSCVQLTHWDYGWTHTKIGGPTHWMPLPTPPVEG